jgi:hypothetical protein
MRKQVYLPLQPGSHETHSRSTDWDQYSHGNRYPLPLSSQGPPLTA